MMQFIIKNTMLNNHVLSDIPLNVLHCPIRLNKDQLKPTKRFSEEQNEVWKKEKRRLCGEILEKLKIRTMEIGRNNTGSGLTGSSLVLAF